MGVYQPIIAGLNVLLFCASTAMIYLGSVLVNFYLLPTMELWSSNFVTVPYLIIAIGVMLLFFSIFGLAAVASKHRVVLASYAGVMGVVFLMQLASVFTSIDFRNELQLEEVLSFYPADYDREMAKYWTEPDVKDMWDSLQRDFQCCGVKGWNTGYKDWERIAVLDKREGGLQRGVPTSCCLREQSGCGGSEGDIFQNLHPEREIYVHGCMTIMNIRLKRDLLPVLLSYIGCSVLLAIIQILAVVLTSAYVAAISRKNKAGRDGMGMYQQPPQVPGTH